MSTYDYFQRAFRRDTEARAGVAGSLIHGADGNCAVFWLDTAQGMISSVHYRCTTCVTLLAFCEHLSELAIGMPIERAFQYHPDQLLALHPDVPQYRTDRAKLASEAFRSAVIHIMQGELT